MKPRRLLARIVVNPANVRYPEFVRLVQAFGFSEERVRGAHHIFKHPRVAEFVNLQDYHGEAKPYQIRQFLKLVERYNLTLEDNA